MEKGLVLHKGHSPSSYARDRSASRARPHTPSPIDLGRSRQCGIAQSRPIIRAQEGCLSQPHKGAAQMGDAYPWPARVPITWYAYCFEMLAYWCLLPSFSIHSPLGHLAHKYKQNACLRHVIVTVQYMVR